MPQRRYQSPSGMSPEHETLPLNTQLTILTRQSSFKQSERNVFSAERNPKDLIQEGRRLGFTDIKVYDWDTGIGAYKTVIEERPGLHYWLHELLPSGKSLALLVSQEDRLFRDRWETQHNRFIEQVATHGGWVICGPRVYNFRRDMDCEQFRLACKYGKQYIEFHIKGRLHPANQRAAMAGRYSGGPVSWGYIVDYEPHSPTYMHYIRYEPHAELVIEHLFRRFAAMANPTVFELVRYWHREGLVWPFFEAQVDERRFRWLNAHARSDEALGGYPLHFQQAQNVLTDVAYLGWRTRKGDVARDEQGQPKICHESLIEPDLFWWCFDRIAVERPPWAPPKDEPRQHTLVLPMTRYRPRRSRTPAVDDVRFLVPGKVRCAVHGNRFIAARERTGTISLRCTAQEAACGILQSDCLVASAAPVERAVAAAFLEQLTFDERDIQALAQVAQRQQFQMTGGGELLQVERQLAEQRQRYERAKRIALQAPDLETDVLAEIRQAKETVQSLETRQAALQKTVIPSAQSWRLAERAATLAERIKATFLDWPRQAQAPVLSLVLDDAILGRVSRKVLGIWMRWHGGSESRREIDTYAGQLLRWTKEEEEALRTYYGVLSWEALGQMLPTRTLESIDSTARRLGLKRPRDGGQLTVLPLVVAGPTVVNAMQAYGFPLMAQAGGAPVDGAADGVSSPWSRPDC